MPSSPFTAVVLNYGRELLTTQCIHALEASAGISPAILIVDNNSPDGSGERLRARFPQHDFLQTGENLGYAGGNALGVARAIEHGAEFVLVINDDAEVGPDTLAQLIAALQNDSRAAAASPTIVYDDAARSLCWAGGSVDLKRALGTPLPPSGGPATTGVHQCSFVSGCCVLLRAEAVREEGSFRAEYFAYIEDVELSVRLARAGWRLLHVADARVVHHTAWPEPTPAPWKLRLRDLNRRRLVAAHYSVSERRAFARWFYPTRVALMANYLLRLDFARARAVWRGMTESTSVRFQARDSI